MQALLAQGADPNAKLYAHNDSDVKGLDTPLVTASLLGNIPTMQALIEKGANANLPNGQGIFPLMAAAIMKHPQAAHWLLDHQADARAEGATHLTALHCAVRFPVNQDLCKRLLARGVDINAKREDGTTPLMTASDFNCPQTLRLLLEHQADVKLRNAKGQTALALAKGEECRKLLKAAGARE